MIYEARLKFFFAVTAVLLAALVALGWYGIYFLNANEILMEDDTPMTPDMKFAMSAVIGIIVLSWTFSLAVVLRQLIRGYGFTMDENGICSTCMALGVLAFIFVIPVKRIPYGAIKELREENGVLVAILDRRQIDVFPLFRLFVRGEYHFMHGYVSADICEIRENFARLSKDKR